MPVKRKTTYSKPATYFQAPTCGSKLQQAIPVVYEQKGRQVVSITKEGIASRLKWAIENRVAKSLFPLIQGRNTTWNDYRVSKQGKSLNTSLAFMDFDGYISPEAFDFLSALFEDTRTGCCIRTHTQGRAKVVLAVEGTPSVNELSKFMMALYKQHKMLNQLIPPPDTTPGGLLTAFISSEGALNHLTSFLPLLHVWRAGTIKAIADQHNEQDLEWIQIEDATQGDLSLSPSATAIEAHTATQGDLSLSPSATGNASLTESGILEDSIFSSWGAEAIVRPERVAVGLPKWKDLNGDVPAWLFDRDCMGDQAIKHDTLEERFMRWLLSSSKALLNDGLAIPQREVSEYLGVSHQALGRIINRFMDRGWLVRVPQQLQVLEVSDLELLSGLPINWQPIAGEGGEVVGIEIDYLVPSYCEAVSKALGYRVKSMAYTYVAVDMAIRYACHKVLGVSRVLSLVEIETRLGQPENMEIPDHKWWDELWCLAKTGCFKTRSSWYDYTARIPGLHAPANKPRPEHVDGIWSVMSSWESVSRD